MSFEGYWEALDQELATLPARAVFEPLPVRSSDRYTAYTVRMTSTGPYRIFGYLSVPNGAGPHPALLETPRYGSVNHVPDHTDRLRYVVLTVMHRGQRLADQPFSASYPGLLTLGIEDPATYVYRGIVADCLRAAEVLLDRPEVDRERVAVSGDDLALITAARRPRFAAVRFTIPLFYRVMELRLHTTAYPLEEINDHLRAFPDAEPDVARTLALFDPVRHAPAVRAATLISGAGEWTRPLEEALGGSVERYELTHEGGTDHDWVDAWLARRLGVEPMSRFRRVPA
jgi:cephalosporin-C deacetylase